VAYFVWGVVYALFDYDGTVAGFAEDLIAGYYHMWYLPMMAGLYAMIPLLRKITEDAKLTAYFLILFRRGKETLGDLFSGFEFFGKTLGLFLWMCLWIILWALIPIAGPVLAIIAGFRYAMAFMIQVDNPSLPIRDCLNRSKFMMKGNKGKLFLLTLSFIGWLILAAIPGAILGAIFGMFTSNIVVLQIVSYIASFATSVVVAYITTAQMAFYDMLTGRIYGESYVPGRY
jgi:uncharacterized membrane protein